MKKKIVYFASIIILLLLIVFKDTIYFLMQKNAMKPFQNINTYYDNYLSEDYYNSLKIMNIENKITFSHVYSKIVFRDIYDFKRSVLIYKGLNDEIKEKMAVINEDGLVGIIDNVNENTSKVKLLTNKDLKLSVKVNNAYGILEYNNDSLIINGLTNYDAVNINDTIYTSGLVNIPFGINVGHVEEIKEKGLEKIVYVKLDAHFENLNYVVILKDLL